MYYMNDIILVKDVQFRILRWEKLMSMKLSCFGYIHWSVGEFIYYRTQIARIAALDSSWAHLGNGLNAHNNPAWLQLYLSVCKLLDLALALPADVVPQFQL